MPRKLKVIKTGIRIVGNCECEVVTLGLEDEQRRDRYIGCPWEFFRTAVRTTNGKAALVLALMIYRRGKVRKSQTVTLPPGELTALGITRKTSHKALRQLQAAGLVQLHPTAPGHKTIITLLWPR
jgi:hypothetical protein